jgi:phosphoenolpyruvate carboxykinase (ATP)
MLHEGVKPAKVSDAAGLDVVLASGAALDTETYWNLPAEVLVQEAVARGEGRLLAGGALAVVTAPYTGRSPRDKFIVREPSTGDDIWYGPVNEPLEEATFERLYRKTLDHLAARDRFVTDACAGADPAYRLSVRVVSELASAALFAHNMFIPPAEQAPAGGVPDFTVFHAPRLRAAPAEDGVRSEVFIALHFGRGLILIGGSSYAGEIKKSVFTALNYVMAMQDVLPMHCAANVGEDGDSALYFGLSGTGKTTLSADPARRLVGDDEHGWSDDGIFNFEGGCYAKLIRLDPQREPDIYATTRMAGTLLENVVVHPETGALDLDSTAITENTRGSYPITHIANIVPQGLAGHPRHIFFLAADAFGVLPPISLLTPEQAMYHFISGYTARLAGTERGVIEPQATFSACFGEPFLPMHPSVYADMLKAQMDEHPGLVWLVNTGWTGGPYGVGHRIGLAHTRALIHAALDGALTDASVVVEPVFGLRRPETCPDVPDEILDPRATWPDAAAYDRQASQLARMFEVNFAQYAAEVDPAVLAAGPRAAGSGDV